MSVSNLLTIQRIAQLLNVPEEDIVLAIAKEPPIREIARANGNRIYDREAVDLICYRLREEEDHDCENL